MATSTEVRSKMKLVGEVKRHRRLSRNTCVSMSLRSPRTGSLAAEIQLTPQTLLRDADPDFAAQSGMYRGRGRLPVAHGNIVPSGRKIVLVHLIQRMDSTT